MSKRNLPTISQANPSKLSPTDTNTPKTSSAISQYMGALRSPIIKLTTSCKDTTFYVHQVLLIRHSPFLHHVINSAGEDLDRTIDLQAWDIETIGRFVHFLYFDTYEAPKPSPLHPLRGFGKGESPSADPLYDPAHDNESHRSWTQLEESRFCVLYPEENYNYRSVLLAHAYLYDLARWFEIESLERIAYKRVELILKGFKTIVPHSPLAVHIVGLLYVVYIYKSNVASSVLADPMRKMVSQFTAMNFAAVGCTEEMKELLRQKGELAVDILQEVGMRLDSAEGQLVRPRDRW